MNTYKKMFLAFLAAFLMLGMTPASSQQAVATADHPFDQAVLLMFSGHMRLNGEVESAQINNAHLAALSSQTQAEIDNEIKLLQDLYATMIADLQASGNYNRNVEDQLVAQLNEKVDALQAKAQALEARRSQRRGGFLRGIARVFNRVIKAVGRGTGWVMGKAMDGAGKVAEFAIEEVTPKVLKAHLFGGAELNAKLFRLVARDLLKKRVRTAAENYVLRLAERVARRQAAQGEAQPTLDAVAQATLDTFNEDLMDAFGDGNENQPDPTTESSGAGSSPGANVVVYDFTASDAFNFTTTNSTVGFFNGQGRWGDKRSDGHTCQYTEVDANQGGAVHLEFDLTAMTVTGWVEGSGQETENFANGGEQMYNLSGNFYVTFTDLPVVPAEYPDSQAILFAGEGSGTGSISGSLTCVRTDPDTGEFSSYSITDSASNSNPVPVEIVLYVPGYTSGGHPITMSVTSDFVEPADGFKYRLLFSFDQPIDVPLP